MPAQIETAYSQKFSGNVRLALQQEQSMIEKYVTVDTQTGEGYRPEVTIGRVRAQKIVAKNEKKTPIEPDVDGRWIVPGDYDVGPIAHTFSDEIRLSNALNVEGMYVKTMVAAVNREIDTIIMNGYFGTNQTGKYGSSTATFDETNMRVAAGGTGLTYDKILEARKILMANQVNIEYEQPTMIITEKQWGDLMTDIKVINTDYTAVRRVDKAMIEDVLQFKIVVKSSTEFPYFVGSERRIPFFVKSGVLLNHFKSFEGEVTVNRNNRGNPTEAYGMFSANATRLDEKKCGEILCVEA